MGNTNSGYEEGLGAFRELHHYIKENHALILSRYELALKKPEGAAESKDSVQRAKLNANSATIRYADYLGRLWGIADFWPHFLPRGEMRFKRLVERDESSDFQLPQCATSAPLRPATEQEKQALKLLGDFCVAVGFNHTSLLETAYELATMFPGKGGSVKQAAAEVPDRTTLIAASVVERFGALFGLEEPLRYCFSAQDIPRLKESLRGFCWRL